MRNLVRADLRRVFRYKIFWIIPSVAMIFLCTRVIAHLVVHIIAKFFPVLAMLTAENNALNYFGNYLDYLNFALSVVIFIALYSEDFKSMTMIGLIGYGLSRKKIVLTKFIDCVILTSVFYLFLIPLIFVIFAVFGQPISGKYALLVLLQIVFSLFKTIATITIASLALYVSNNIPLGIFSILILQIIPLGLSMISYSPAVAMLHIDRYYIDGLFNMALTDFMLGLYPEGILMFLITILVYIVAVLVGIMLYFDKKELDF